MPRQRQKETCDTAINVAMPQSWRDRIQQEADVTERSEAAIVRSALKAAGYDKPAVVNGMPKP